ncbi:MAG: hypothetical protein NUV37_00765 [Nanoarchaeota archaeon]|nr:hypothetical protein [Nanoarchaeota archaeon]
MINVLFICKHNVFRSKVAEAYFKKINKNKNIKAESAGIIKSDSLTKPEKILVKKQRETAKSFGIMVRGSSRNLKTSLLSKQDIIIITADDVPNIFKGKFYLKPNLKVIKWQIPDVKGTKGDDKGILNSIQQIIQKVGRFVKEMEIKK